MVYSCKVNGFRIPYCMPLDRDARVPTVPTVQVVSGTVTKSAFGLCTLAFGVIQTEVSLSEMSSKYSTVEDETFGHEII